VQKGDGVLRVKVASGKQSWHPVAIETAARATRRWKLSMERAGKQFREQAGLNHRERREGLEQFNAEADPAT
jgi:hypothetical protein